MAPPCSVVIDGITYTQKTASTSRAVVVVDRGWIFAGDIRREDKRIYLENALWLFRWESVGFAAVIEDPVKAKADIRRIANLDIPESSEIFCIPVPADWGVSK